MAQNKYRVVLRTPDEKSTSITLREGTLEDAERFGRRLAQINKWQFQMVEKLEDRQQPASTPA